MKKGTVKSEGGGVWQGEAVREGRKFYKLPTNSQKFSPIKETHYTVVL